MSTAAQRVENRQLAERARRCSETDDPFGEANEKIEVAREESAGEGGVVIVPK